MFFGFTRLIHVGSLCLFLKVIAGLLLQRVLMLLDLIVLCKYECVMAQVHVKFFVLALERVCCLGFLVMLYEGMHFQWKKGVRRWKY